MFTPTWAQKRGLLPCCVTQPQRKTRFLTAVLLSNIFEHLPKETLANKIETSLSARFCLVNLKYPSLPLAQEQGLSLTWPQHQSGSHQQNRAQSSSREVLIIVLAPEDPFSRPASSSLLFRERLMNADGAEGDAAVLLQGSVRRGRWGPCAEVRPRWHFSISLPVSPHQ